MKQMTYALKLAGAATLAGSTQAYSQIVQLGSDQLPKNIAPVPGGSTTEYYNVATGQTTSDVSHAGADNLTFFLSDNNNSLFSGVSPIQHQDGVVGFSFSSSGFTYAFASALPRGAKIGSGAQTFLNGTGTPNGAYLQALTVFQPLDTPEYIGFQFLDSTDNSVHNGWLELTTSTSSPGGLIFLGGAYAAVAGADIPAGQVPEPGTLSSLVLGAAALGGIGLLRRRRASLVD